MVENFETSWKIIFLYVIKYSNDFKSVLYDMNTTILFQKESYAIKYSKKIFKRVLYAIQIQQYFFEMLWNMLIFLKRYSYMPLNLVMNLMCSYIPLNTAIHSVYISEMRYYVHYLHFSDYCPHLCHHVYQMFHPLYTLYLLQVVGMSNLTLYFTYQGRLFYFHEPCLMDVSYQLSPVNFSSESSQLPSPGIEPTLFGYVTGSNQRLYPLCHVSLRTSVYEFQSTQVSEIKG